MIRTPQLVGILFVVVALLSGCVRSGVEEKVYELKPTPPLDQAKQLLENYAKGTPPGSEMTSFPQIINEVRKTDPQKAEILEKGVAELQRSQSGHAEIARELLKKL